MNRLVLAASIISSVFANCTIGYTLGADYQKCYKVYEQPQTYFAASHACTLDGAQLVSIHSATENSFVLNLITVQFGFNHWIGLTNLVNGFEWEWLDSSTVSYNAWATGQPAMQYHCATVDSDSAHWITQDCDMKLPFICIKNPCAD